SGLLLSSKAFNCSDAMPEKTSSHYYVFSNIAPIAKEKYATPEANRIYIDYKIAGSAYQKTTYSSYNALLASLVPVFHSFDAIEEGRANSVLRKCWKEYGEATNEL